MPTERIMWTVVPAGVVDNQPRLSVLVGPQLAPPSGSGALGAFPQWVDWQATLASLNFRVVFGDGSVHPATRIAPTPVGFDPWAAMFDADTPVRSWQLSDLDEARLFSYPADKIQRFARERYTQLAAAGPDLPAVGDLDALDPFDGIPESQVAGLLTNVEQQVNAQGAIAHSSAMSPLDDFAQFLRYYQRPPQYADRVAAGEGFPELATPQLDFHDAVALAGNHPQLLRQLGLALDLQIERGGDPLPDGTTTVRLEVLDGPRGWEPVHVRPRTRCGLSVGLGAFVPTPDPALEGGSDLNRGFLALMDPERFAVIQLDAEGAGAKLLSLRSNLTQRKLRPSPSSPTHEGAPTLRNHGLGVTRLGRARRSLDRFARQTQIHQQAVSAADPGADVLLGVDDLVRGVTVEVRDDVTGRWRSATRRDATYEFFGPGGGSFSASEEGFIGDALNSAQDPDLPANEHYQQESLFSWDGWSLVSLRPGSSIDGDDELVDSPPDPLQDSFALRTTTRPTPGSLPRLRYGRTYRLRARGVDLTGRPLPTLDDTDAPEFLHATAPQFFGRFDPVPSPTVVQASPRGPAESVDRVAIRSDLPTPISSIVSAGRHVAPPRSSQVEAELHGMFDRSADGPLSKDAYATLVAREGQTFATSTDLVVPYPDAPERDWYHPVAELDVPYLPDPLARGVRVAGLPGTPATLTIGFAPGDEDWPDSRAFRIEAVPAEELGHEWDAQRRMLQVFLPKGRRVTLRLSSVLDPGDLSQLGLVRWLQDAGSLGPATAETIQSGRHWMFTPSRSLELVHAVRRPMASPDFLAGPEVARQRARTDVEIAGQVRIDEPSTQRVELLASWTEPIDDGPGGEPPSTRTVERSVAVDVPIDGDTLSGEQLAINRLSHHFGDTRHRVVTYEGLATSRYGSYFAQDSAVTLNGTAPSLVDPSLPDGIVAASVEVRSGDTTFTAGVDYEIDGPAGTITRTDESSIPSGTQVDVRFVAEPVSRIGVAQVRSVPSSERPDPPKVRSVVPTFAWSSSGSGLQRTSTRAGNSVRVYLERPWWSSGEGELLGVVLAPDAAYAGDNTLPDAVGQVVTRLGRDPIHNTAAGPLVERLQPVHLPLRTSTGTGLHLEELPDQPLVVAGHPVTYDPDRDLWFADIAVDAGRSHWPFLRLALCRYQPSSLPWSFPPNALQISTVTVTDPIQLAPERIVRVDPFSGPPGGPFPTQPTAQVTVTGPAYLGELSDTPAPSQVRVLVQRRSGEGELDWDDVQTTVLTASPPLLPGIGSTDLSWSGSVAVGQNWQGQVRLIVEEREPLRTDGGPGDPGTVGYRLVHQDLIEL